MPVLTTVTPKKGQVPSANQLSISYAAGTKWLVVDAKAVQYLHVYRAEGCIEVCINLEKEASLCVKLGFCSVVPTYTISD